MSPYVYMCVCVCVCVCVCLCVCCCEGHRGKGGAACVHALSLSLFHFFPLSWFILLSLSISHFSHCISPSLFPFSPEACVSSPALWKKPDEAVRFIQQAAHSSCFLRDCAYSSYI